MLKLGVTEHQASRLEIFNERLIGILEEDATNHRHIRQEGAIWRNWVDHRQSIFAASRQVIGTESWSLVYQAGAIFDRDVISEDDIVRVGWIF